MKPPRTAAQKSLWVRHTRNRNACEGLGTAHVYIKLKYSSAL